MTIVNVLRGFVLNQPSAPMYQFLDDDEEVVASLSRGELDLRARAVAAQLVARGLRGERVLLLYAPGMDFIVAYFGCLYAGAIAVPAYPPEPARLARTLPRLQAIVADCEPALVLTTSMFLGMAPMVADLAPDLARAPWAASDEWASAEDAPPPTPPSLEDVAFIQYTSGSTQTPKGVVIGHDTLLSNLRQICARGSAGESTHCVSWLPFYHDMGLICGIAGPAFFGGRSTLMSPLSFLKRPASWLRAMHRFQADVSPAPPFALDLCVRKVTPDELVGLDLSNWSFTSVGAEPIRRATLDRFSALLAPCGFNPMSLSPGYGLAEAVLGVTHSPRHTAFNWGSFDAAALEQRRVVPVAPDTPGARMLVGCGAAVLDQHVAIVDPTTHRRVGPDSIGEIWAAGPNIARGYFRRESESAQVFGAQLEGEPSHAAGLRFLRTGDLGFMVDGELYITGRMKDLIILHGRNHHPQDIEHTVEGSHRLVRPGGCAAFSTSQGGDVEELAVAAEVDARSLPAEPDARRAVLAEISAAIRHEVTQQHALNIQTLALLQPGQLPKTSSGKVMRRGCRDDLLAGRLVELDRSVVAAPERTLASSGARSAPPADRSQQGLITWLMPWFAARLGVPVGTLTPDTPFAQMGLDSLQAVSLAAELGETLGQKSQETVFLDCPDITQLAQRMSQAAATTPNPLSCLVKLAHGGSGAQTPLILIPGIFGMLSAYSHLVKELGGLMPLWGLDTPVHHGLATPASVEALAAQYVDGLLALPAFAGQPFRIAGYCAGGMVAVELARQLEARGRAVERIILIDAPYLDGTQAAFDTLLGHSAIAGKTFTAATPQEAIGKVVRYAVEKSWTFGQGQDFVERMVAGGVANLTSFQGWEPRPVATPTSLISALERVGLPLYEKNAAANAARWERFLGRMPKHLESPGHHHSMLQTPHVSTLARLLVDELSLPLGPR